MSILQTIDVFKASSFNNVYMGKTQAESPLARKHFVYQNPASWSVCENICEALNPKNPWFFMVRSRVTSSSDSSGARLNSTIGKVEGENNYLYKVLTVGHPPEEIAPGLHKQYCLCDFTPIMGMWCREEWQRPCLLSCDIDGEANCSLFAFNQLCCCCRLSFQNENLTCVIALHMNLCWLPVTFRIRIISQSFVPTLPTPSSALFFLTTYDQSPGQLGNELSQF